jgi:hypothetical protein
VFTSRDGTIPDDASPVISPDNALRQHDGVPALVRSAFGSFASGVQHRSAPATHPLYCQPDAGYETDHSRLLSDLTIDHVACDGSWLDHGYPATIDLQPEPSLIFDWSDNASLSTSDFSDREEAIEVNAVSEEDSDEYDEHDEHVIATDGSDGEFDQHHPMLQWLDSQDDPWSVPKALHGENVPRHKQRLGVSLARIEH